MVVKQIYPQWDRENLNNINENFRYLGGGLETAQSISTRMTSAERSILKIRGDLTDLKELNVKSEELLTQAELINMENVSVKNILDDLVLNEGQSDAEVVQARGEHNLLYNRLDAMELQNLNNSSKFDSIGAKPEDYITNYSNLVIDGDWSAAMNEALKHSDNVVIPAGFEYEINNVIVPSHKTITAEEGTIITTTGSHTFKTQGELLDEVPLSVNAAPHSNKVSVTDVSPFEVGDDILIRSQRNALSFADASNEWYLGMPTNDNQVLPFGEFAEIIGIEGNELTLSRSLIYPSYLADASSESAPAQSSATVTKVDFVEGVTIKNMRINKSTAGAAVLVHTSKHVNVEDIYIDNAGYESGYSNAVYFTLSYLSEAKNCRYSIPATTQIGNIDELNPFKIASSMACGFRECTVENASQSMDMSYLSGMMPNTLCYYIDNTTVNAKTTGFTTHPGNYLSVIEGNRVFGTAQGFSHRGRGASIQNNQFVGNLNRRATLHYGIGMYGGFAADNTISNNTIRNFYRAIGYFDQSGEEGRATYVGNTITNNNIYNCNTGVIVYRLYTGAVKEDYMGIVIKDNNIRLTHDINGERVYGVLLQTTVRGVEISNNIIKGIPEGRKTLHYGVFTEENVSQIKVTNNTFIDLSYGINNRLQTQPSATSIIRDNQYINVQYGLIEAENVRHPSDEDKVTIYDADGKKYILEVSATGEVKAKPQPYQQFLS